MKIIKSFQLFPNHSIKSEHLADFVRKRLVQEGFHESDQPDLAIAIGGDGSFLHMVHENAFNTTRQYIGINTGTLGFLQDINGDELDAFIAYLKKGDYSYELSDIQRTVVHTKDGQSHTFLSLNEVVVRRSDLRAINMDVCIDGHLLEHFAGDGLLVSTSVGSTAYNMSFQGSVIDPSLKTMQITPIAPLTNKRYHNLLSSVVIPDYKRIGLHMPSVDVVLTIDGNNAFIKQVYTIEVEVAQERLLRLVFHESGFASRIHKKLLIDEI